MKVLVQHMGGLCQESLLLTQVTRRSRRVQFKFAPKIRCSLCFSTSIKYACEQLSKFTIPKQDSQPPPPGHRQVQPDGVPRTPGARLGNSVAVRSDRDAAPMGKPPANSQSFPAMLCSRWTACLSPPSVPESRCRSRRTPTPLSSSVPLHSVVRHRVLIVETHVR